MIPTFTKYQIRGILVQLSKINYVSGATSDVGYGQYRFPDKVLQAKGFKNNTVWLGKNAITSANAFTLSVGLQDTLIKEIIQSLYLGLINNGTRVDGDPSDIAAGFLLVSYFLLSWYPYEQVAAEATRQWKLNNSSPDNAGCVQYFNYGRYSINQLSIIY
jgi:hypothetical protein